MNTPNDKETEQLETSAKALFDDSVERLDAATLSRLNQGRQAALAELENGSPAKLWLRWAPVTGAAAAVLVAVVVLRGPGIDGAVPQDATATDFEILMNEDSLEMIEDLEFYSWIDVAELDDTDNVG